MSDSDNDSFSDDGEDVVLLTNKIHERSISSISPHSSPSAVNKSFTITHSGQLSLDGGVVYEEIRETNVSFGPTNHNLDTDAMSTIVYPSNMEVRKYQESIVKHALMENVLCALPTGLGKTFIASTVMLNFYRWIKGPPDGKIIFMAPTRPLVAQQMRACYGITGIPLDDTAVLLDISKKDRKDLWTTKRVFFSTPQVVANDLRSGIVDPRQICCIVIDEAHRARGNYAYCTVVAQINRINTSYRILALTATPGSDTESVQQIIDNLSISSIEVRTENDSDVSPYVNSKAVVKVDCPVTPEIDHIIEFICVAILPALKKANAAGIYDITDPARINQFRAFEKSRAVIANHGLPEGLKWTYFFQLKLLAEVGMFLRRLNIYGIKTFYTLFLNKYTEFTTKYEMKKSTNRIAASFYYNDSIKKMKSFVEALIREDARKAARADSRVVEGLFSHSKLQELVHRLIDFLKEQGSRGGFSSVIVFTEFRESALEIVRCLESANRLVKNDTPNSSDLLRPHIFIGQAKEKDKFDEDAFRNKNRKKKRGEKKQDDDPLPKKRKTGNASASIAVPASRVDSSVSAQAKGMTQKVQKELLSKFKEGIYNILVATSIGEEGLDIGEVDMIVCFDSTSSPIKNIQRMGRTGRKRAGNVVLLFSGNEREKFEKAMDNYQWIQNQIRSGDAKLDLHPSDRILPKEYEPQIEYRKIEIPEENKEVLEDEGMNADDAIIEKVKGKTKSKGKKTRPEKGGRQAKLEKRFFMPDNVETGFRPASTLVRKVKQSKVDEKKEEEYKKSDETLLSENVDSDNDLTPSQLLSSVNASKDESIKSSQPILIDLSEFTDDELRGNEFKEVTGAMRETSENFSEAEKAEKPGESEAQKSGESEAQIPGESEAQKPGESEAQKPGESQSQLFPLVIEDSEGGDDIESDSFASFISGNMISSTPLSNIDSVFTNQFSPRDGFMTSHQEMLFYSQYFTEDENACYDPRRFNEIDDPLICVRGGGKNLGRISHSTASKSIIEFHEFCERQKKRN
ncbi:hypothetical protein FOA43_001471 [Brettanomyces nanus]|uniref:ATP-dependent DNA helicase n=1 Tax=Eeniella nana TaxID=13502 RepID=A0A875RU34_EENNA|nr:uncharacterized protein FOA43_001471 [Brettanomyces nanus]QPG74147.1 hypothetical protein FOA43_001471 [Brettanomyces nanus]